MSHIIWLCITSVLSITSVYSDENIDTSHLKIFPPESIAGIQQVTYLKDPNNPQYAFNASEAREVCQSLGLAIASAAQVETALRRGLETCRFGWIDEHYVVVPRIQALGNCGNNRTGLVPWRPSLRRKFDAFCFNESDAAAQLKDDEFDSLLSSSYYSESPTKATDSTLPTHASSHSTPKITENLAEVARFVDSAQSPAGGKAVLISCTCAVLLIAVIIVAYLKLRRSRSRSTDVQQEQQEQQREYIQTEEWTRVKNIKETGKDDQEDEGIEDNDHTQRTSD